MQIKLEKEQRTYEVNASDAALSTIGAVVTIKTDTGDFTFSGSLSQDGQTVCYFNHIEADGKTTCNIREVDSSLLTVCQDFIHDCVSEIKNQTIINS